jgi:hypothetical protein
VGSDWRCDFERERELLGLNPEFVKCGVSPCESMTM